MPNAVVRDSVAASDSARDRLVFLVRERGGTCHGIDLVEACDRKNCALFQVFQLLSDPTGRNSRCTRGVWFVAGRGHIHARASETVRAPLT